MQKCQPLFYVWVLVINHGCAVALSPCFEHSGWPSDDFSSLQAGHRTRHCSPRNRQAGVCGMMVLTHIRQASSTICFIPSRTIPSYELETGELVLDRACTRNKFIERWNFEERLQRVNSNQGSASLWRYSMIEARRRKAMNIVSYKEDFGHLWSD